MLVRKVYGCFVIVAMACVGQAWAQSTLLVSDSNGTGSNGDKVVRFVYNDAAPADVVNHFASPFWSPIRNSTSMLQRADGNILVCSYITDSILEYDGQTGQYLGEFVAPSAGGLNGPIDMLIGPYGDLWVTSMDSSQIIRYDGETGGFLSQTPVSGPRGIALNPVDGYFYVVAAGNRVQRYNPSIMGSAAYAGEAVIGGLLNNPQDVIFRPDGGMYISNYNTRSIVTVQAGPTPPPFQPQQYNNMIYFVNQGQFGVSNLAGMTLDSAGAVLAVERGPGRVLRFTPGGSFGPAVGSSVIVDSNSGGLGGGYSLLLYDPPAEPDPCPADMNNDGVLNFFDVSTFLSEFGAGCP